MQQVLQQTVARTCLTCDKILRGRADKKFCNDYCRNTFNNSLKSPGNNFVRNVNNALGKNRRILQELLSPDDDNIKVQKEKLLQLGFQFKYFTHHNITATGGACFYCYDHGWIVLENDWYLVVREKEK